MTVSLSPVAAHPELAGLIKALESRDWPAVAAFFAGLSTADEHVLASRLVGEVPGVEGFLRPAMDSTRSLLAQVLLAARHVELGWEARTGKRAKHVTQEGWEMFRHHLHVAEQLLIDAVAAREEIAAAWAVRLNISMGLSLGLNESRRRYDRLSEHHPHTFLAQTRMVQQLCPKWGGTWEQMHAFARECLLAAPEGALNGALVAEGHLERWLELGKKEGAQYLREPQVQSELREAAERSVLHPAYRPGYGWVQAHGYFAMAFGLAGEQQAAAPHFRAMNDCATEMPWGYAGYAYHVFVDMRRAALGGGQ